MIEQSLSLPLAFSAARIVFSSSLNNCKGVGEVYPECNDQTRGLTPFLARSLIAFKRLRLSALTRLSCGVECEYSKNQEIT